MCNYLKRAPIILCSFLCGADVHVYAVNNSTHKSLQLVPVVTSHISRHIFVVATNSKRTGCLSSATRAFPPENRREKHLMGMFVICRYEVAS